MATTAALSKRAAFLWLALGLIAGLVLANLVSFGGTAKAQTATTTGLESVRTDVLEANFVPGQSSSKTTVWFRGSGFVPGTPVSILIKDSNGVLTDISTGASVDNLAANDDGAWATMWTIGRFTRAHVGAEGMFTVVVVDKDYNILATTPLALCNDGGDRPADEAIPSYCKA